MTQTLRSVLESGRFVTAPGVFEMLSAKIADRMGFAALYMTGYGISASHLGQADAGLVTYTDMVSRARTIAEGTTRPLIADADTGFGGLINVRQTVRGYEAAGVQAIQIEDQEMPKKCGHTPGRRVVPLPEALKRIEVALDARQSRDFLIIARTDARTSLETTLRTVRSVSMTKVVRLTGISLPSRPRFTPNLAATAPPVSDSSGKSNRCVSAKRACLSTASVLIPTGDAPRAVNSPAMSRK